MSQDSHPFTRVTPQLLTILEALLGPGGEAGVRVHGWQLRASTGYTGPTVYTVLHRLADVGWVGSEWEASPLPGAPPRRFFWLLPEHVPAAQALLAARRRAQR